MLMEELNMHTTTWFRVFSVLAILALTLVTGAGTVSAQDATPVAECLAPELPPGEPTPMEEEGSPVAEEASPVAEGADATPPAEEEEPFVAEGPVRPITLEAAQAGLENLQACIAAGDFLKLAALMTPDFLSFLTETGNPYDVPL